MGSLTIPTLSRFKFESKFEFKLPETALTSPSSSKTYLSGEKITHQRSYNAISLTSKLLVKTPVEVIGQLLLFASYIQPAHLCWSSEPEKE